MKRKQKIRVISLILIGCLLILCSCMIKRSNLGTYYLHKDGNTDLNIWIKLESDNKWSNNDGQNGRYSNDGESLTFYVTVDDAEEVLFSATVGENMLTVNSDESTDVYYLEGTAPESPVNNDSAEQELLSAFTYTKRDDGYYISGVTDANVTNLVVPDCVVHIDLEAFSDCYKLESITLPASLFKEVNDGSGQKTTASIAQFFMRTQASYVDSNRQTYQLACYSVPGSVKSITISGDLTKAGLPFPKDNGKSGTSKIIYKYSSVKKITYTGNLEIIDSCALYEFKFSGLEEVSIPNTVKKIESSAFHFCKQRIKEIHYAGTKAEWAAIDKAPMWKGSPNDDVTVQIRCTDGDITITQKGVFN